MFKKMLPELSNLASESLKTKELELSPELLKKGLFEEHLIKKNIDTSIEIIIKKAIQKEKLEQAPQINNELLFHLIKELPKKIPLNDLLNKQLVDVVKKSGFDNIQDALNQSVNEMKQSPLQNALEEQNIPLAKTFISLGAKVGPAENAALEILRDTKVGKEFGLPPLAPREEKLHPVKKFGLVLGITMTSVDGTYSQYGHMGPTYQLMTDSVNHFASIHSDKTNFQEIAGAFSFANRTAAYSFSTSRRNPEAGRELSQRIQSGKLTTIPVGCTGHIMGLSYVPDSAGSKGGCLVYTNRGSGASGNYGTDIFRIDDASKITPQFINNMLNGLANGTPHDDILLQIQAVAGNKPPIHHIRQSAQKRENCSIANPRSNIEGILLCQKALEVGGFDKLTPTDVESVKQEYKQFTKEMRLEKIIELADELKKNPQDLDLKNLALEYLKQHPTANATLKQPLEEALALIPEPIEQIKPLENFFNSSINKRNKNLQLESDSIESIQFLKNIIFSSPKGEIDIKIKPENRINTKIDEALKYQQEEAIYAVLHGEPKPTESFMNRLINTFKFVYDSLANITYAAAKMIGLQA